MGRAHRKYASECREDIKKTAETWRQRLDTQPKFNHLEGIHDVRARENYAVERHLEGPFGFLFTRLLAHFFHCFIHRNLLQLLICIRMTRAQKSWKYCF